jgi:hypothetical protein
MNGRLVLVPLAVALTAFASSTAAECPRTFSEGPVLNLPAPEGWYGSDSLAVLLKPDGRWTGLGPEQKFRDKLFWASSGFRPGDERDLRVTATPLDGGGDTAVVTSPTHAGLRAVGGFAMLVLVEFPRAGCWEVTGEYRGQRLSFVVEVMPKPPVPSQGTV